MFESALGRYEAASGRLGTGAILSIAAHVLVVGGVLLFGAKKPPEKIEAPEIVFQAAKPPPLKGTPGGTPKTDKPETKKTPPKRKDIPILTKDQTKPPEQTKDPEPEEPSSGGQDEGPGNGGVPDGSEDGVVGGTGPVTPTPPPPPPPPPTSTVLNFGGDMDRPVLAAGPSQPEYPPKAAAAHIESVIIARCVITTDGSLHDCQIIKGHPFLNPAVEDLLAKRRYRPVLYGGKPVNVRYTMTFNFKLQ